MSYYQPELETMPREQLHEIQREKLVEQIAFVYDHVPYYRAKMEAKGVTPADITSLEDVAKLPFLSKDDLREAYPYGMLGVPLSECVRIQSTSGTTGRRVIAFYTQQDLDMWAECCARAVVATGATTDDVVQVCYGYGLFTGGMGLDLGATKAGCLVLPMSSGNTDRQLQFMRDLSATILCCTPSYALHIADTALATGEIKDLKLKAGIFGAEAWTEEMRQAIEVKLNIRAHDIYGLTELSGPGIAFECAEQGGMHINEDHFLAEIVDPDTDEVLPYGQRGELVLTALDKRGFPMVRYRTHDICVLDPAPCRCGRTHVRMSKPLGRSDDMLIVRGVNVFPSQIETVLLQHGLTAHYLITVDRVNNSDTIDVTVECEEPAAVNDKELSAAIKNMLGISVKLHLVPPMTLPRSEGKAVRVVDKRKLY